MSGRKLGGGRILGSGKGLGPPSTPAAAADVDLPRSRSPFPPSESSLSIGSSAASPSGSAGLPDFSQDLNANISLGGPSKASRSAGQKLLCPICNEEMVRLIWYSNREGKMKY